MNLWAFDEFLNCNNMKLVIKLITCYDYNMEISAYDKQDVCIFCKTIFCKIFWKKDIFTKIR